MPYFYAPACLICLIWKKIGPQTQKIRVTWLKFLDFAISFLKPYFYPPNFQISIESIINQLRYTLLNFWKLSFFRPKFGLFVGSVQKIWCNLSESSWCELFTSQRKRRCSTYLSCYSSERLSPQNADFGQIFVFFTP